MKMETTGSKNPADEMMDRLAEAAWKRLADTPPSALHIDDIALDAGVSASAARAVAGSITALIMHQLAGLDRRAVLESLADIEDAGEVSIRDKIVEALMHRFEVYAPYRAQITQLDRAARRDPDLWVRLLGSLSHAMRMLLRMAGDDLTGLSGEARVRGVALVAIMVARVWQKDDTPDLSTTLKDIDNKLARAEEWGRSLRVLRDGASSDTSANHEYEAQYEAGHEDENGGNPGGGPTSYQ